MGVQDSPPAPSGSSRAEDATVIGPDMEAKILRLHHAEKWTIGTIAKQLGVHHSTVRRVLAQAGLPAGRRPSRASMVDPYLPFILQTLEQYPTLRASRLYEMVRARGYPGGPDHFRHLVACHRPRPPAEAYLRLRTLPGEQAQMDWGHFGRLTIGKAERPLVAFVMVLSFSREIFLRFFLDQRMSSFLTGHVEAFNAFAGVSRVVLYDNLKSAVLERHGDAIRFHPTLLEFAAHYRFEPRPVAVARGNEKGRVERAIRYVRHSFFAARRFRDLAHLNQQAAQWCREVAGQRPCPEDRSLTVQEAFEQEKARLLPLPETPFPTFERLEVRAGKTPYVRFDGNDYSVPHDRVRRTLVVLASERMVRVLDGNEEIARHERSYDKREQIEEPAHIEGLARAKKAARSQRGIDRLQHSVPVTRELLVGLAERGGNIGSATAALLRLLDHYGTRDLELAVKEALAKDSLHPSSVRHLLETWRRERTATPPLPVTLPDDPRVKNLAVRPHSLDTYDELGKDDDDGTPPTDSETP